MSAWVQHLKLKIAVLKWTAVKLKTSRWGGRIDISVSHEKISFAKVFKEARARVDLLSKSQAIKVIDMPSKEV